MRSYPLLGKVNQGKGLTEDNTDAVHQRDCRRHNAAAVQQVHGRGPDARIYRFDKDGATGADGWDLAEDGSNFPGWSCLAVDRPPALWGTDL